MKICVIDAKFQQTDDVLNCHGGSLLEFLVIFQQLLDDVNCRFGWHRCEQGLHIIGNNAFMWLQPDVFNLLHKVYGVLDTEC